MLKEVFEVGPEKDWKNGETYSMNFAVLVPNQTSGARYTNFAYAYWCQDILWPKTHLLTTIAKSLPARVLLAASESHKCFLMTTSPVVSLLRQAYMTALHPVWLAPMREDERILGVSRKCQMWLTMDV